MEILREHEMLSIDADVGSIASRENLLDIADDRQGNGDSSPLPPTTPSAIPKPRIVKPWESRLSAEEEVTSPAKGIRGRRRVLYSPPMKRATVPPAVPPKPAAKPAARANSSPVTSPKLVRGTRTMALLQAVAASKKEGSSGKTSPNTSPRSHNTSAGSSSIGSPRSTSSGGGSPKARSLSGRSGSRTQSPVTPAPLVRQGTFTKDETTSPKAKSSGIPRQTSNLRQASSTSLRGSAGPVNRTPPKVPPKPMFRRDTVQPSPTIRPATTKTQQLREKSLSRGGGARSSTSSASSVTSKASSSTSRTSIRTSSSSHSLRNAAAEGVPKRTPSSSEIERRRTGGGGGVLQRPLSPAVRKPSTTTAARPTSPPLDASAGKKPAIAAKKDVTSKIASLWKRVEDSHKQKKDTAATAVKDKRVWISKGKVQQPPEAAQPPPPGRLIRSGTYEKIADPGLDAVHPATGSEGGKDTKSTSSRSRSRLSIKLSKFGLSKRGKGGSTSSTVEDQLNGNPPVSPDELGNNSLSSDLVSPTGDLEDLPFDPTAATSADRPRRCRSDESSGESMSTGPDPVFVKPSLATSEKLKNNAAQIKRNSSYVSSMGRKREDERAASSDCSDAATSYGAGTMTSSSVVTLV